MLFESKQFPDQQEPDRHETVIFVKSLKIRGLPQQALSGHRGVRYYVQANLGWGRGYLTGFQWNLSTPWPVGLDC